jgi:hypothetical protein
MENYTGRFAFISRHEPTTGQFSLAEARGVDLVPVGDADAFTVTPSWVYEQGAFDGVVVVHPAAAMNLAGQFLVGVFENINRAPVGERPLFEAKELHIYDLRE